MNGGLHVGVVPKMHSMSSLSLAGHLHHGRLHVQGRSHAGIVFSGVWSLIMPMLTSAKHLEVGVGH